MTAARRFYRMPAALIGVLALVLAGCGVKGDLDPPPRQNVAGQGSQERDPSQARTVVVYSERSRIRGTPREQIHLKMPPSEWSGSGGPDLSIRSRSDRERFRGPPSRREVDEYPDDPFLLDWLL